MSSFSLRRFVRRLGTLLLVSLVLVIMLVEWLSGHAYAAFHWLVAVLRLARIEEALKKVPVWASLIIFTLLLLTWVPAKFYVFQLLREKEFVKLLIFEVLFKVLWFGAVNYLLRLFGEQYLRVPFIARWYGKYLLAKAYLTEQAWHKRIVAVKRLLVAKVRSYYTVIRERFRGGKMRRLLHRIRSRCVCKKY